MTRPALALWGGVECTVNRVGDRYHTQLERSGHADRPDDIDRFAALGIAAIRYPVLWERTAPDGLASADWRWPDARLARLRELEVRPIVGLVHHGSGPRDTSLVDDAFPEKLAVYAAAVARRYPWVADWTPVNEPLTTARFSGLYGVWYPHGRDERTFGAALVNQCRAVVLAMRAIREINPAARLVQTDDLGKSHGTPTLTYQVAFNNEIRWLGWDLLCGRVDRAHPLWGYLTERCAVPAATLDWFAAHPCPPDLLGVNHYITSERWLDERLERYPERFHGSNGRHRYADIETARSIATPATGLAGLLGEVWERYRLPVAITEAHLDATREDQLRWLADVWHGAQAARDRGVDVRAVTVWALLGSFDWNCLVRECRGYYEPGPYDVRAPVPRPTALANMMRDLAHGQPPQHPVLAGPGWWHRDGRFFCPPVELADTPAAIRRPEADMPPVLVIGATGTLGRAFARICAARGLAHTLVGRAELDIADADEVERALERHRPWAVVNAAGYVRVDEAERDAERCFRENTHGAERLAAACARHGIALATFSSDLVFDGRRDEPYVESDRVEPLGVYGRSKAEAEQRVLDSHPASLVARTSAFFGPWDDFNFVTLALRAFRDGRPFAAAADTTISPTYVPDLVHATLDLLVDGESGLWHLANDGAVTWAELARRAAAVAGVTDATLCACTSRDLALAAPRPRNSALASERARLMPGLEDALVRYVAACPPDGIHLGGRT
jgi:dTDP-4-dehydrorhamnose reductase